MEGKVICGGEVYHKGFSDCLTLTDSGSWKVSPTLKYARFRHSSWKSENGVILIGDYRTGKTTELLKPDGKSAFAFNLQHSTESNVVLHVPKLFGQTL